MHRHQLETHDRFDGDTVRTSAAVGGVTSPAYEAGVVERRRWWFPSPLGFVTALVGAALAVVGVIALLRGGLDGPLDQPVVSVAGLDHTPLLGLIEIGAGVAIMAAGLSGSRGAALFVALLLAMFGVIVLAQTSQLADDLAVTDAHGWWALGLAGVIVVSTLLTPVRVHDPVVRPVFDVEDH